MVFFARLVRLAGCGGVSSRRICYRASRDALRPRPAGTMLGWRAAGRSLFFSQSGLAKSPCRGSCQPATLPVSAEFGTGFFN